MMITRGTVVDGRIRIDGEPLKEGTEVAIVAPEPDAVELTAEEEAELLEADRGELIPFEEVPRNLGRNRA